MNISKIIYIIVGVLTLGLGTIGAALPLLPTVPFLLLAAFCFGKSSTTLDHWFRGTKLYQNNLDTYVKGKGMTKKTKLRIILLVTTLMGIGFCMMGDVPIGRILLCGIWVFHMWYFVVRVKTIM
ncbi:MAG: YbaN family protein [Eubacteriales bacterium]